MQTHITVTDRIAGIFRGGVIFTFSQSSGIHENLTRKKLLLVSMCMQFYRQFNSHINATIAIPTVTKLQGPTLFLGLQPAAVCAESRASQPISASDTSQHAANYCTHNHNTAQLDKDLHCEYLWYKLQLAYFALDECQIVNEFCKFTSVKI